MKKICIDLRPLQIGHQNRGIGMYLKSVLEHLQPGNKYVFYCFNSGNPIEEMSISVPVPYTIISTTKLNTVIDSPKNLIDAIRLIYHRFGALKSDKPDVFIQPDFALGLPRWHKTKTIVIGYDLIPLIYKHDYMPSISFVLNHTPGKKAKIKAVLRSIYYKFKYKVSYQVFKRADHVVCISKSTRDSFEKELCINSAKLESIPLAPVISMEEPDQSILKKITMPYVFYIGGTDSRKNVEDIVYAFNIARGRGLNLQLVLAGNEFVSAKTIPSHETREAISRSPYKKDIITIGFVSNAQKIALYQSALAFIFTTLYEGFGLPVVEAMALSCPVISYSNSSIPEAAGNAGILVPTNDYVAVAEKVIELQSMNDNQKEKIIASGQKQSSKFSWDNYAEKLQELF